MTTMNEYQNNAFEGAVKMTKKAEELHRKGSKYEAMEMLKNALNILKVSTREYEKNPKPEEMVQQQAHMTAILEKWQLEWAETEKAEIFTMTEKCKLERAETEKAKIFTMTEKSKPQAKIHVENIAIISKVLEEFTKGIKIHENDEKVKPLIIQLTELSSKFYNDKDFSAYKENTKNALADHKSKHIEVHHKQPSGVFDHIVNVVRAMFRLLEKMVNRVANSQSTVFKKPDSELGKAAKEFTKQVEELKEFKEPTLESAPKVK